MQKAISNNFKILLKPIQFSLLLLLAKITNELFKCHKYLKTQFLACLLVLLVRQPQCHLVISLVCLIIGLAIDRVKSIGRKVAVWGRNKFLLEIFSYTFLLDLED